MKRRILSGRPAPTDPFTCSEFCAGRAGKERNTDCVADGDAQPEQDLLQVKGVRKDLVISWIIQARIFARRPSVPALDKPTLCRVSPYLVPSPSDKFLCRR